MKAGWFIRLRKTIALYKRQCVFLENITSSTDIRWLIVPVAPGAPSAIPAVQQRPTSDSRQVLYATVTRASPSPQIIVAVQGCSVNAHPHAWLTRVERTLAPSEHLQGQPLLCFITCDKQRGVGSYWWDSFRWPAFNSRVLLKASDFQENEMKSQAVESLPNTRDHIHLMRLELQHTWLGNQCSLVPHSQYQ